MLRDEIGRQGRGIAYQRSTGDFFVSSTTDGTIYRGNVAQRTAQPFLPGNTDGRTTATGLKIDRQGRLFVCGAGSGLIFVYDTQTKALLAKLDTGSEPTTLIASRSLRMQQPPSPTGESPADCPIAGGCNTTCTGKP